MIDLDTERIVSFGELCKLPLVTRPRAGRALHLSVPYRWWKHGRNGVRLESILIAGRRCTSIEAFHRFLQASERGEGASIATPAQRRAGVELAARRAEAMGI